MALSNHLMEIMGGTLTVQSEPGVGSTFTAQLKLAVGVDEGDAVDGTVETPEHDQLHAGPAVRLLYIEDDVANIKLVERVLQRRPAITVQATGQGRLGIELARHDPPDVMVLDLNLPDLTGEQVLATLKSDARTERIPVIILTADASADRATRLRELGADAYLTKPLDVPGFLAAVDELLLTGALVSQ